MSLHLGRIRVNNATATGGLADRLLALTGCRRGEVLDLRWRDIGDGAINRSRVCHDWGNGDDMVREMEQATSRSWHMT